MRSSSGSYAEEVYGQPRLVAPCRLLSTCTGQMALNEFANVGERLERHHLWEMTSVRGNARNSLQRAATCLNSGGSADID